MANRVGQLNPSRSPLRDDGSLQPEFQLWAQLLTNRALIVGTGTPEGAQEANQGALYMDDAGTAGAIIYVKRDDAIAGDKTQGWILV